MPKTTSQLGFKRIARSAVRNLGRLREVVEVTLATSVTVGVRVSLPPLPSIAVARNASMEEREKIKADKERAHRKRRQKFEEVLKALERLRTEYPTIDFAIKVSRISCEEGEPKEVTLYPCARKVSVYKKKKKQISL